ncbi:hypothetical protein [Salinicola aestuarinus]|uniref:hypothetical protein n=1 Tax=Salinicola aestuarinus TaxID=1949082 RepID=UPI000DA25BF9|nr:hypothetical protein [Salinicola aestuarinus]
MGRIVRQTHTPTAAEKLEREKSRALAALNDDYEADAAPLVRDYPQTERLSWDRQLNEAQAYQQWRDAGEGEPPATPTLESILRGRNGPDGSETLADLVDAVLRRADRFLEWQEMTGIRHRGERMIENAETIDAARAVTWESLQKTAAG